MDAMPRTSDSVPDFEGEPDTPTARDGAIAAEWLEGRKTGAALVYVLQNPLCTQRDIADAISGNTKEATRLKAAGLARAVGGIPEEYVVTARGEVAVVEGVAHEERE